jgi:hypothetical protein
VGVCLIIFGIYDTLVYRYAIATGKGTFDFFGKELPGTYKIVRLGFTVVLIFYYVVGLVLLLLG